MTEGVERTAVIESKILDLTNAMDKVSNKMDVIHELARTITRIQEQQIRHNEGLERAFDAISAIRTELNKAVQESEEDRNAMARQLSFWRGALLIVGGVLMVAQTALWRGWDDYSTTIDHLKESSMLVDKRITVLETVFDKVLDSTLKKGQ